MTLHAFFDESGDFKSDRISWFTGFVADVDRWNAFSHEWATLLNKRGLPTLHATDFLAPRAPMYAALNIAPADKVPILREFAGLALKHAICGYQIGVNAAAYKAEFGEWASKGPDNIKADSFAFLRVIKYLHLSMEAWGFDDSFLECVFDEREDAKRFLTVWNNLKGRKRAPRRLFASISFADDLYVMPLQAADLLGCCAKRSIDSPGSELAMLFDAPDDPVFGPRIFREVWTAEALATNPELETLKKFDASLSREPLP